MSPAKPEIPVEDVLLAFSVEPFHDRTTLEHYLKHYPQFAEDLVDMSHELRIGGRSVSDAVEDDATFQRPTKPIATLRLGLITFSAISSHACSCEARDQMLSSSHSLSSSLSSCRRSGTS